MVVGLLAFLGFKFIGGSGTKVEGVESMPPEVRKAYSGHGTQKP